MISPYWNEDFWGFFQAFGRRIGEILFQKTPFASDEIQVFTLSFLAISCALLGGILQLRKMVMLANSLSHTILLGIIAAFLVTAPSMTEGVGYQPLSFSTLLIASFITALFTSFFTQFVTHSLKLQEDASIGLVFTSLFALGIVAVTLFTRNVHLGTEAVMGNPDVLQKSDCKTAFWLALVNIGVFTLFFRQFQILSFDKNLASALGIRSSFFHYLLMLLLSATAIASFRAVGVLLVLSFLVCPFLIARRFCARLRPLLALSCFIGIVSSFLGVALSRHFLTQYGWALSTGGIVSTLLALFYLLSLLYGSIKKRVVNWTLSI